MAWFFPKRMTRVEAEVSIAEFLKETPAWLQSRSSLFAREKGCILCGMREESIDKLLEALRVLHPELSK